ncbi:hypothetical protein B0T17DRAFT_606846 [Bombardia bombarda]|uniref:Uncharacterized protein n=1 Tax=Bombardia bombarda TaxID=252184 RepID=A0AA39XAG6_9PEZI|nr:hypothetical protein B0T17DRAFT_606846 [Bombardia bombarda]
MAGSQPPFMYQAVQSDDGRYPAKRFDPKAVTRASYDSKAPKPKQEGPLVSVNRHPDAHMVPSQRSMNFRPIGRRTKAWIRHMRSVQLGLRASELIAAVGLFVLMILINNVEQLTGWVVRITLGVAGLHCVYAIYHLIRPAGGRTPGSSAAYHLFASLSDLCILPLYTYGVLAIRNNGEHWGTLLHDQGITKSLIPAVYYALISAAGLHLISLAISLWLAVMFRRITMMPPDMNPLESHLTSRAHKRNKSSVAASAYTESEKRLSTPLEDRRRSGMPYEDLSRPPKVPFMHTRQGSQTSFGTGDSRLDLPSRQYQLSPSTSPRNSATSLDIKRMSAPPLRSSNRASYIEVPPGEALESHASSSRPTSSYSRPSTSGRPSSGTVASYHVETVPAAQTAQPRAAKFTEAWYASESLVNRTQERNRSSANLNLHQGNANNSNNINDKRRAYEALNSYEAVHDSEDSDNDENNNRNHPLSPAKNDLSSDDLSGVGPHPNPLRSNPALKSAAAAAASSAVPASSAAAAAASSSRRPYTPFQRLRNSVLGEINLNDRRVSGDITDNSNKKWEPRNRDSSIQPESDFYSKPYGDLRPATPPVMIGGGGGAAAAAAAAAAAVGGGRQVSSGNDYDLGGGGSGGNRRHVSGKIAEEGRAGGQNTNRYSRYSILNEL